MSEVLSKRKAQRIRQRLERLYGPEEAARGMKRFHMMLGRYGVGLVEDSPSSLWNETDTLLITYPGSIRDGDSPSLQVLGRFFRERLKGVIRNVHLLPFFPWSSDDGFGVIDHRAVEKGYGTWKDVEDLGKEFGLAFDLVLNHCSRQSSWFRDFVTGVQPYAGYFLTEDPEVDLSAVARPCSCPLLTRTATRRGDVWVWTTFSADEVDLNWHDPNVLFEFIDILFWYVSKGMRMVRLGAVAFLWKQVGTDCLHRPETHELVKLIRDVLEVVAPKVIVLTETNVPHGENLSYFGAGDEAHMIYNYGLPPLLLHALLRGDATCLTEWARSLPELPPGQVFLNLTASHNGIGLRPVEGILDEAELNWLVDRVRERGGRVSMGTMPGGLEVPYELNVGYRSALSGARDGKTSLKRFLCSQAVMLAMRGIPAIYIHSLLGTENDLEGMADSGEARRINRKSWEIGELVPRLEGEDPDMSLIYGRYLEWLERRRNHPAFHPEAPMKLLSVERRLFGLKRTSLDGSESVVCLFNLSDQEVELNPEDAEAGIAGCGRCRDILSGEWLDLEAGNQLQLPPYHALWLVVPPSVR